MSAKIFLQIVLLVVGIVPVGVAQGIHAHHESVADTHTITRFFQKGKFKGHARSYWSATVNEKSLTDYYAWGIGAGIGYETPRFWKRWQVGMSGFFMFNVLSSDLSKPDPKTGQLNRYEIGLFDIEHPNDHKDLDRLEELYVKFHTTRHSVLTVGRQVPQSPFINPQDGRMRPTLVESAMWESRDFKNFRLQAEYIWGISPRSTVRWFGVGESVGVYPVGVDAAGKASHYAEHVLSKGIGVFGIQYRQNQWDAQLWNTLIDNVNNTLLAKIEWKTKGVVNRQWMAGIQLLQQHTVGEGGNPDPTKAYALQGSSTGVISVRIGRLTPKVDWYLNATRIGGKGRYLMPREWGREPFYTFLPRERNEGMGNVAAATFNAFYRPQKLVKLEISGGYYGLPDVRNFALNKYGIPSYAQANVGLTYQFDGYFKGLNALILLVGKYQLGETYDNARYVFNKVNMTHFNFILNYHY